MRKSRQATNWTPADERRRGSQGILISICETEMEQVTSYTREQHQTGNGNFGFQVGLKPTKMCNGRSAARTRHLLHQASSLVSSTPPFKVLKNVPQRFRCLESCLTPLCLWKTRASTSQVTSLLLGGHTVKLSAAFGCRERTESIAHHHHVAIWSRMFLGYNFVATLRDTATCSRCSTRRAIHEVSALLTNEKYSSYDARTTLKLTASSTVGPRKDQRVGYHVFAPVALGALLNHSFPDVLWHLHCACSVPRCGLHFNVSGQEGVLNVPVLVSLKCVSRFLSF